MKLIALPVLFLLAASQVAVAQQGTTPAAPAAAATEPAKPAEEPKMICRNEFVTGSRVQKQRVCRPANETGNPQSTALQRELDKFGNSAEPPTGGFGN